MIRYEMSFGIQGNGVNAILATVVLNQDIANSKVGEFKWHQNRIAVRVQVQDCLRRSYGEQVTMLLQREVYVPEVSDV